MEWKKLGVLIKPDKNLHWMSSHAGPSFVDVVDEKIFIYITGRDRNNVSRIGLAQVEIDGEEFRVMKISKKVLFDVGEPGTFDESGVSYPWLLKKHGKIFMYYVGWVAGGLTRFQNYTGLAISSDGGKTFQRIKKVPILDRTDAEPYGSGSCCVFLENDTWKMYYTAFEPWNYRPDKSKPSYNIKLAHSTDGIEWKREQKVIINFKKRNEYVIGKPVLLKENGIYKLWYSYRGESYRIGYAESKDGLNFTRKDTQVGIDVSTNGWDGKMIEYAFVFNYLGRKYMVYNGNDFGKTGLGLAVLKQE